MNAWQGPVTRGPGDRSSLWAHSPIVIIVLKLFFEGSNAFLKLKFKTTFKVIETNPLSTANTSVYI